MRPVGLCEVDVREHLVQILAHHHVVHYQTDAGFGAREIAESPNLGRDPFEMVGTVYLKIGLSRRRVDRASKVELVQR